MDASKFRLMARDIARVQMSKVTDRDIVAARKATYGYSYLVRELDGLMDCILNGPNDHLMPEVHSILDALEVIGKMQRHEQADDLPPELQKILEEEFEAAYERQFGARK